MRLGDFVALVMLLVFHPQPYFLTHSAFAAEKQGTSAAFSALYKKPGIPTLSPLSELIGAQTHILAQLDVSTEAVTTRQNLIRTRFAEFKASPLKSPQTLQLGQELFRLLVEQNHALEYFIYTGFSSQKIRSDLRNSRSLLMTVGTSLNKQYPNQDISWTAEIIIVKLKNNDPNAINEANAFIKKHPKSQQSSRVRAVMIVLNAIRQQKTTMNDLRSIQEEPIARMASLLLQAEMQKSENLHTEFIKLFKTQTKTGALFLLRRSAILLTDIYLGKSSWEKGFYDDLIELGLNDVAQYYLEQIALRNLRKDPKFSVELYQELFSRDNKNSILQIRIIDIAIQNTLVAVLNDEWNKLNKQNELNKSVWKDRIIASQRIMLQRAERSPQNIDTFIMHHDMFWAVVPTYRSQQQFELNTVKVFKSHKNLEAMIERGSISIPRLTNKDMLTSALSWHVEAREQLLKLPQKIDWSKRPRLQLADTPAFNDYVERLTQLAGISQIAFREYSEFKLAYQLGALGLEAEARTRFEKAVERFRRAVTLHLRSVSLF